MSDNTQAFIAALGISNDLPNLPTIIDDESSTEIEAVEAHIEPSAQDDFETGRKNILDMVEKGKKSLDELANIASQSQHPRAFEVFFGGLKTIIDAQKDLLDLRKKKQDLSGGKGPDKVDVKTTNNLFVGSPHELQAILKGISEA